MDALYASIQPGLNSSMANIDLIASLRIPPHEYGALRMGCDCASEFTSKEFVSEVVHNVLGPMELPVRAHVLGRDVRVVRVIHAGMMTRLPQDWTGDNSGRMWYVDPPKHVDPVAHHMAAVMCYLTDHHPKYPKTEKGLVKIAAKCVRLSKKRSTQGPAQASKIYVLGMVVAAHVKSEPAKAKALWKDCIDAILEMGTNAADLLRRARKNDPTPVLWQYGTPIDLIGSASFCATNAHFLQPGSSTDSICIIRSNLAGKANHGDWPFGVGVEMTWSLANEPSNSNRQRFTMAAGKMFKRGRVYIDGDNLEFATPVIRTRARLHELYSRASAVAKIMGLPFDTKDQVGGGFHVNVSIDKSHPLHNAFAKSAGNVVGAMPWLSWCLNDAWDDRTARNAHVDPYDTYNTGFGDKSSAVNYRGNRLEYRFMSMPRTTDEAMVLVDLCMAITVEGKRRILCGDPPMSSPYKIPGWLSNDSVPLELSVAEVRSRFNESVRFLGLDPKSYASIVNRHLPTRISRNKRFLQLRRRGEGRGESWHAHCALV